MAQQSFSAAGYATDESASAAWRVLENTLVKQQTLITYNHGFLLFAILIALCLPVVLLIRNKKTTNGQEETMEMH